MSDLEHMEAYLKTLQPAVGKNVAVSPDQILYHISKDDGIKTFRPRLTQRTAGQEDRTVPRVSTAPTIFGCLLGYSSDIYEFDEQKTGKGWRGGWYIYQFQNTLSLRPTKKILFDAEESDEHWLVPYTPNHWTYPSSQVGKFFYRSIKQTTFSNNVSTREVEVVFEVFAGQHVSFDGTVILTEGFWTFTFHRWVQNWKQAHPADVRKISKGEYLKIKGLHATLLSYEEPPSAKW